MQEMIFQSVPYIAGLASGVLLTSAVTLRMMRKAGADAAARCSTSARAMFVARSPAPVPAHEPPVLDCPEPETEIDDGGPPPALAGIAARRAAKRLVRPEVAAREFIAFMREHNHVGWFASEHIDDAWLWFCSQTNTVEMDPSDIRAQLAAIKACRHGYKRLKGPEFEAVRRDLNRDRATVYYIPPKGVPLDASEDADRHATTAARLGSGYAPSQGGSRQAGSRPSGGVPSASGKNARKPRSSAPAAASPGSRHGFDFIPGTELAAA